MCGIAGILGATAHEAQPWLSLMLQKLHHRGPNASAIWQAADQGVSLGHTRLSIQDLSEHGAQPMHSKCARYVMSYNGEVYNLAELLADLDPSRLSGHSDTEIILEHISRHGLDATLQRLIGMFAIALFDKQSQRLYLIRDRLGIKPIYYSKQQQRFSFASELKALAALPFLDKRLDPEAVGLYFRHNYILEPHTIYQHVFKLEPGYVLCYDLQQSEIIHHQPFWRLADHTHRQDRIDDYEQARQHFHALIEDAVKIRLRADVPLGAFLSGGYDSTAVVALMQKNLSTPVNTFSIGFHDAAYNEAPYAKQVASVLGTRHTECYIQEEDMLALVPKLADIYCEPFADSSQLPTCLVSQLASQQVTVCLTGDGGDELFAGYSRYHWFNAMESKLAKLPRPFAKLLSRLLMSASPARWDTLFGILKHALPIRHRQKFKGAHLHKLAGFLEEMDCQTQYATLIAILDPTSVLMEPVFLNPVASLAIAPGLSSTALMQYLDFKTYLPGDILTKVDRATMAYSLEARVPLLDHRLVQETWRLPESFKVQGNVGKRILRDMVHQYVPEQIMARPKMGFGVPVGKWMRGKLRDFAETHLAEGALLRHDFYDVAAIRAMWREHLTGRANHEPTLWAVLMLQAWLD